MPVLGKVGPHVLLHAGWSTGLTLENVRLKVEAFEYLQLPFNITEGCIGRLVVQVRHAALAIIPVSQRHGIHHDLAGAHRNHNIPASRSRAFGVWLEHHWHNCQPCA